MGTTPPWPWRGFGIGDPRPWLLEGVSGEEPAALWTTLTGVLDHGADSPEVVAAHRAVMADPATHRLLCRLPERSGADEMSGHDSPRLAPNLVGVLADHGVFACDDSRIAHLVDEMLAHQSRAGRFPSYGVVIAGGTPVWGPVLCEGHAILEVLVRNGLTDHPAVVAGLDRLADDMDETAMGRIWLDVPSASGEGDEPARTSDACPQVTLEGLRIFSHLPSDVRPRKLLDVARVSLHVWHTRGAERPNMFGHGRTLRTARWPVTWHSAFAALETLGRYPQLWREALADPGDRTALAELVACLIRYNVQADGTVTYRSAFRGFEALPFTQRHRSSGFATARVLAVLHRFEDLADEAAAVDLAAMDCGH